MHFLSFLSIEFCLLCKTAPVLTWKESFGRVPMLEMAPASEIEVEALDLAQKVRELRLGLLNEPESDGKVLVLKVIRVVRSK